MKHKQLASAGALCAVAIPSFVRAQGTFVIEHDVVPHVVENRIETDAVPHGGGGVVKFTRPAPFQYARCRTTLKPS